ncbi:MAG: hypothetical protein ABEI98_02000, partial [Halorhabdus sp.]
RRGNDEPGLRRVSADVKRVVDAGDRLTDGTDVDAVDIQEGLYEAIENRDVSSRDVVEAIDTVDGLSGVKRQRAARLLVRAGGEGAMLIADASGENLNAILSLTLRTEGTDYAGNLDDKVRETLAVHYAYEHFGTDRWGGDLYPKARDGTDVAAGIARDVEYLDGSDRVTGLLDAISSETGGGHLESVSPSNEGLLRGAALEVRSTRRLVSEDEIQSETIRMSYEPTWGEDYLRQNLDTDGEDSDLKRIANDVYGNKKSNTVREVRRVLGLTDGASSGNAEFDAVELSNGEIRVYYESKNFANYRRGALVEDIRSKAVRLYARKIAEGADLNDVSMTVYTRNEESARILRNQFDDSLSSIVDVKGVGSIGSE